MLVHSLCLLALAARVMSDHNVTILNTDTTSGANSAGYITYTGGGWATRTDPSYDVGGSHASSSNPNDQAVVSFKGKNPFLRWRSKK